MEVINEKYYKLIIVICALMPTLTLANNKPEIYALHINGIDTTFPDAMKNTDALKSKLTTNTNMVIYNTVYNPTKGETEMEWWSSVKGALDVSTQKFYENNIPLTLDEFTQHIMVNRNLNYQTGTPEYSKFRSEMVESLQHVIVETGGENMQYVIDEFHGKVPLMYADVLKNLKANNVYQDNKYVLLLPHSQGNIYANELYTYLTQTEGFSSKNIYLFGFASPAAYELGSFSGGEIYYGNNYITSSNDSVVGLVRSVYSSGKVLSANVTIAKNEQDKSGHGLISTYLNDSYAVERYNKYFKAVMLSYFEDIKKKYGKYELWVREPNLLTTNGQSLCESAVCTGGLYLQFPPYTSNTDTQASIVPGEKKYRQYYLMTESVGPIKLYAGHSKEVQNSATTFEIKMLGNYRLDHTSPDFQCDMNFYKTCIKTESRTSKNLFGIGMFLEGDYSAGYLDFVRSYRPDVIYESYIYSGLIEIH